jgi:hypothetical protein
VSEITVEFLALLAVQTVVLVTAVGLVVRDHVRRRERRRRLVDGPSGDD